MQNLQSQKKIRSRYLDHLIPKFIKPPKENERRRKEVRFNEKGNRECNNNKNNSDQKICASMSSMSDNDKCPSGDFGDCSQLNNWILDPGSTCHITPEVSYFIPGLLEDTDKHIEVANIHHITAKQKRSSMNKNV